ncbi:MAG: HIT family protein [Chlorobi bacterium]|nr:HIT family protein [Chlorobiota bacterium]
MKNCVFCNIDKNKIIAKSEYSLAFFDNFPVNKGHILIIPKNHIENYFDLSDIEKKDIWKLVDKVKIIIEKKFNPDGFNIGINIGKYAGQTINHCHIHIIPRYKGDMDNPEGGVRGVIPAKQKYKL